MVAWRSSRYETLPSRFVARPPDGRSRGSLSQAIREHLCRSGGASTRAAIRKELESDHRLAERLASGQGLARLLKNMEYSGFLTVEGETVRATRRTLHRTLV